MACAGMCGFSMGGVHACMVASLYPGPVACVPLLAPRSAAAAFCHGALREATAWQPLLAVADEAQKVSLLRQILPHLPAKTGQALDSATASVCCGALREAKARQALFVATDEAQRLP